jgi:transcriptional regulator with XRE-family HTH domain
MEKSRQAFLGALGAAVRAQRLRLDLNEEQLAQRIAVSAAAVKRLERGTYNATVLQLQAVAKALDLSLAELIQQVERRIAKRRAHIRGLNGRQGKGRRLKGRSRE